MERTKRVEALIGEGAVRTIRPPLFAFFLAGDLQIHRDATRRLLAVARPLHASHMGCENMGPMLYALCRFIKPGRVLEVGAGFVS